MEWISVEDRLPTDDDFTKSNTREILCSFGGQFMMVLSEDVFREWVEDRDVTHWMKIPTPPKVDKKEA